MVAAAAALLATATVALAVSTVLIAREADEAEAQGQQARQAVGLLTKVSEIGFDDQPDPIQQEFLKNALNYYEQFTRRSTNKPTVKLEHARAYQQMGDIQRKLGQLSESEPRVSPSNRGRRAAGRRYPRRARGRGGNGPNTRLAGRPARPSRRQ